MKTINDLKISSNTAIHCKTEKLARQVLDIFHKYGLTWYSGNGYDSPDTRWQVTRENTCYLPAIGKFTDKKHCQDKTVITAEEFLELHRYN